ncbi:helix-turn-helix domain-containing protein [Porcincola intestinalis]|uniref:Helix-turn-helix transcriptional regulator n=1 Tax=Porcincola intestinalis TaxID=2606632 RepID=A0A6L5X972_9FIRM|nr:helix-turn-helix transcriptional regulator [Porcincola intestinalis]MSS15566.1 helix-turn-helix transcriptional regulator [Porcincola intestinalis]
MEAKEITDLINQERIKQGMSVSEFARRVGVSTSNANYWFRGGRIKLENADKALRVLGLTAVIGKGKL